MSDLWYYAQANQQRGPVPAATLRRMLASGELPHESLVWTDGMPQWAPASSVAHLRAGAFAPGQAADHPHAPPPYPQQPAYRPAPAAHPLGYGQPYHPMNFEYAGFWLRVAAALIDGIILFIPLIMLSAVVTMATQGPGPGAGPGSPAAAMTQCFLSLVQLVGAWLYYALQESSSARATIGKRVVGIRVTDLYGRRISFARASGRYFAEIISTLTLFIGYLMVAFTEQKQALHDMIASTLVVKQD